MEERALATVGLTNQRDAQAVFAMVEGTGQQECLFDIAGSVNKITSSGGNMRQESSFAMYQSFRGYV